MISVWSLKIFAAVDKADILKKACSYTYLLTPKSKFFLIN